VLYHSFAEVYMKNYLQTVLRSGQMYKKAGTTCTIIIKILKINSSKKKSNLTLVIQIPLINSGETA